VWYYGGERNKGETMRLPTKEEVQDFMETVNKIKPPKTELGKMRIVAKFFHCKVADIQAILN
jgi:hypothetical protein